MQRKFEWDEIDNIYHKEKFRINNFRDDLNEVALIIRDDISDDRISVTVNNYMQIVVRLKLNNIETMSSVYSAMEELNNIRVNYLSEFESSSFEITTERNNPVIFCYYDRI